MKISMLIGLTGKPGCGKGTFVRLLKDCCAKDNFYPSIGGPRFSDALVEGLKPFGIPPSRANLQEFAQWLESKKLGAITNGMRYKLENDLHEIKIADGVRWISDENMIRELGGIMVYVRTDPKIRWERIRQRKEKDGDAEKTWEKFLEEDSAKNEILVDQIGERADFKIYNSGPLEDYEIQVKEFYERFVKPKIVKNENPS